MHREYKGLNGQRVLRRALWMSNLGFVGFKQMFSRHHTAHIAIEVQKTIMTQYRFNNECQNNMMISNCRWPHWPTSLPLTFHQQDNIIFPSPFYEDWNG